MSDFLFEAIRERLKRLKKEREEAISLVNERVLKDRDVKLKDGRRAKIIEYFYAHDGRETLYVKFHLTPEHYPEYVNVEDCEII